MPHEHEKYWKDFEENEISHSAAHYLLAIASFQKNNINPKAADLSRVLGISRAAVSFQLKTLVQQKFIFINEDRRMELSRNGADLVARISEKREVVLHFLTEILGVSPTIAHKDACKVEHLLSDETVIALVQMIQVIRSGSPGALKFLKELKPRKPKCREPLGCGVCEVICLKSKRTLKRK